MKFLRTPQQQPPDDYNVLTRPSPPPLQSHIARAPPKGENGLKETVMAAAFSLCCILGDWLRLILLRFDLIRIYLNFQIWCWEYGKTYPSVKEKLYRFTVFRESFESMGSMPNGFGDQTFDELEYLLPLNEDSDGEDEFFESLHKRPGNTYRICEENNQVLVYCYGPNTFRDSDDIKEKRLFERLRKYPGSTYQVLCEGENNGVIVSSSANRCVPVPDQTPFQILAFES